MFNFRTIEFAIFPSRQRAQRAERVLDATTEAEVQILSKPNDLARQNVPLELTHARRGALVGGLSMAAATVLLSLALTSLDLAPHLGANLFGFVTLVTLASLFGALSGSLAFATEASTALHRLHEQLEHVQEFVAEDGQPAVVLIRDQERHTKLLRRHGAIEVGALA